MSSSGGTATTAGAKKTRIYPAASYKYNCQASTYSLVVPDPCVTTKEEARQPTTLPAYTHAQTHTENKKRK